MILSFVMKTLERSSTALAKNKCTVRAKGVEHCSEIKIGGKASPFAAKCELTLLWQMA
jgi:hypothetical protein